MMQNAGEMFSKGMMKATARRAKSRKNTGTKMPKNRIMGAKLKGDVEKQTKQTAPLSGAKSPPLMSREDGKDGLHFFSLVEIWCYYRSIMITPLSMMQ